MSYLDFEIGKYYLCVRDALANNLTVGRYYKVLKTRKGGDEGLVVVKCNSGGIGEYSASRFDLKKIREETSMPNFVVGRFYKAVRAYTYLDGDKALIMGDYYQVVSIVDEGETIRIKTETGEIISFSIDYLDVNDCKEDKDDSMPKFKEKKYYQSLINRPEEGFEKGQYYQIVTIYNPFTFGVANDDEKVYTFNSKDFDVNSGLKASEIVNPKKVKRMPGRPMPMMNKNFTTKLSVADRPKTYDTPGLFRYTDRDDVMYFTILGVSYDPEKKVLAGFIVDTGTTKRSMKEWSWTWDASRFTQIEGRLELNFTL